MNKNNKQKQNSSQALPPNIQAIRDQVLLDELKARHWKAQYETAYYHMKFDEILPAYSEHLEKLKKQREEEMQKQKEYFEALQKEMTKDNSELAEAGIKIEEVNN